MRYTSPLRYPGGKAKLAEFVKSIFRANNLLDGSYAEPYAGGAAVALDLLFAEYAARVFINDIDDAVYAFWRSVLHSTDELCRLVRDTPVTPSQWEWQRRIYANAATESPLALGFAAFFLNRTNRSGIIDSGGMIGGHAQSGQWKLDARYNRTELTYRINRIARYRNRIHVSNLDAIDFLKLLQRMLPAKSLIYLDPPYYTTGRQRLYANDYNKEDHAKVADALVELPFHWMVSYDNVPKIRDLYSHYRSMTYMLQYTAAERQQGVEVMFFSPILAVPRYERPVFRNSVTRRAARLFPARDTLSTHRKRNARRLLTVT